jgi:phosphohistidine phosphatase
MELYIVRHGIAEEKFPDGTDAARALTDEGRRKTARAARGLAALGVRPDLIVSSPLLRARQTAEVLAEALRPAEGIAEAQWLSPGIPPAGTVRQLARLAHRSVLLVGHMPDVSALASLLLTGRPSADIVFKKAAVCALSFDGRARAGCARLEWLLQPRHLRAAATGKEAGGGGTD